MSERYLALLRGDLGRSFRTHELISTEIIERFPATCELTLAAMCFAIAGGLALGMVAAVRRGGFLDHLSMTAATAGISMPVFWLALVLILVLAVELPLFPISGRISADVYIEARTGFETRLTVLGHVQRGGTPTAYDRVLATRLGIAAIDAVHDGHWGQATVLQSN